MSEIALIDTPTAVMANGAWLNNAELIADVARLGYLDKDWKSQAKSTGKSA
jgi:hypothetical protein